MTQVSQQPGSGGTLEWPRWRRLPGSSAGDANEIPPPAEVPAGTPSAGDGSPGEPTARTQLDSGARQGARGTARAARRRRTATGADTSVDSLCAALISGRCRRVSALRWHRRPRHCPTLRSPCGAAETLRWLRSLSLGRPAHVLANSGLGSAACQQARLRAGRRWVRWPGQRRRDRWGRDQPSASRPAPKSWGDCHACRFSKGLPTPTGVDPRSPGRRLATWGQIHDEAHWALACGASFAFTSCLLQACAVRRLPRVAAKLARILKSQSTTNFSRRIRLIKKASRFWFSCRFHQR